MAVYGFASPAMGFHDERTACRHVASMTAFAASAAAMAPKNRARFKEWSPGTWLT
jgi:hypothetical protein